jgi:hypothetical protein
MTTQTTSRVTGSFAGDPAETVASGSPQGACCGSPVTPTVAVAESGASTRCGTVAEARESGGCCGAAANARAVAAGAGCCG